MGGRKPKRQQSMPFCLFFADFCLLSCALVFERLDQAERVVAGDEREVLVGGDFF